MDPQTLEDGIPLSEETDFIKLNMMKRIAPEQEPEDDNADPGDPPGVVEVDTDWTPEDDEEEL